MAHMFAQSPRTDVNYGAETSAAPQGLLRPALRSKPSTRRRIST